MKIGRLSLILPICLALRADLARPQPTAGMGKEEFDRLPSSALLDVGGRKVTKGELLARLERARGGRGATKVTPNPELRKRELARRTGVRIGADNAKVRGMKPQSIGLAGRLAVKVCPLPKIEGILHVPPLEPGEEFFMKGCGFGQEGKARLEFAEKSQVLTPVEWRESSIHVRVPEDLQGVKDQEGVSLKEALRPAASACRRSVCKTRDDGSGLGAQGRN